MAEALERGLLVLGALVSLERHAAEWRERVGNEAYDEAVAQWRARLPQE